MTIQTISVKSLSKIYRVWKHPRDLLIEGLSGRVRHSEFQALTDISFDVPAGSVVGLMGRNGAGKSTLLRIIAGTLDASGGSAVVAGRIAAILELGTGFHPDYTGRENVFLGGLCLGLSRNEIKQRFDEIVDFAELWDFIDQPFRTYSSGMQARLTFAVATCVDPDILIIDEALGVGDARFQLKSFDRIRRFKEQGKSILLVSHNIAQIVAICDRAILLEKGRVLEDGDPNVVGKIYHELLFAPAPAVTISQPPAQSPEDVSGQHHEDISADGPKQIDGAADVAAGDAPAQGEFQGSERERRYGLREVEIVDVKIEDANGQPTTFLQTLTAYKVVLKMRSKKVFSDLHIGFLVRDLKGIEIFGWDTANSLVGPIPAVVEGEVFVHKIAFRTNLSGGQYFLTASIAQADKTKQDMRFDCLAITVAPTPHIFTASFANLEMRLIDRSSGEEIYGRFERED
ncbi:ABC transporter ATP-binding protein [Rhodopseudomonas boonkerdii]|uniref:ABC transporter ATP-binding protein n=1 Tax=Rhodopseudomonas boonkerdii TaxID=475937 RepID=UPI001E42FEBC|nr:ABC transporter ATP-binding protein [Rhodopseudomonas boonkerdii]UGV25850.1 ABC transporter ATP-binding protein [Rhodopseudomonas boonkerdii]